MSETLIMVKLALTLAVLALLVTAGLWLNWQLRSPSHTRDWQPIYATLPDVTEEGGRYRVTNIRNWSFAPGVVTKQDWLDVTLDPAELESVYFLVKPFGDLEPVAHTMLAFEFADGTSYVASVEARRTVGEAYGGLKAGVLPMHEYMFVWATERDMYGFSTIFTDLTLFLYKLELSDDAKRAVLVAMLEETAELSKTPRFYNTFFSNCTNVLARAINKVVPDALPWHISWHLPGLSPKFLYKRGLIAAPSDFDNLQQSAHITPIVADFYDIEDPVEFAAALRSHLKFQ